MFIFILKMDQKFVFCKPGRNLKHLRQSCINAYKKLQIPVYILLIKQAFTYTHFFLLIKCKNRDALHLLKCSLYENETYLPKYFCSLKCKSIDHKISLEQITNHLIVVFSKQSLIFAMFGIEFIIVPQCVQLCITCLLLCYMF